MWSYVASIVCRGLTILVGEQAAANPGHLAGGALAGAIVGCEGAGACDGFVADGGVV